MSGDGRRAAEELVETTGASKIIVALLRSGPSYVKSLSYDVRLVDKTIRKALELLLEMKLVTERTPDKKAPHAKSYYDLTTHGREVAVELDHCNERMIKLLGKMLSKRN